MKNPAGRKHARLGILEKAMPDNPFKNIPTPEQRRERFERECAEQDRERIEMYRPENVIALVELGATTQEITELTGYRWYFVHEIMMRHWGRQLPTERRIQLERVETMIVECWHRATIRDKAPNIGAIMSLLKREAALLGLDEPKRQQIDTTITTRKDLDLGAYSTAELEAMERVLEHARLQASTDVTPTSKAIASKSNGHA